jgi:hypothetical protein
LIPLGVSAALPLTVAAPLDEDPADEVVAVAGDEVMADATVVALAVGDASAVEATALDTTLLRTSVAIDTLPVA